MPTGKSIRYRLMQPGEEAEVINLVSRVFDEFVAPEYGAEGIAEFYKYLRQDALSDRLQDGSQIVLAEFDDRIVGVVEMHTDGHVALLFVDKSYQGGCIATDLLRRSTELCGEHMPDLRRITVNSSPNAHAAYQRMGFRDTGTEKPRADLYRFWSCRSN